MVGMKTQLRLQPKGHCWLKAGSWPGDWSCRDCGVRTRDCENIDVYADCPEKDKNSDKEKDAKIDKVMERRAGS